MSDPQKLSCPTCGAPLPPAAAHRATACPFCGAATSPAPRVVERVIERIVVAPAPADAAGPGGKRCPRCARGLEEVRSAAKVVDVCGHCGGVWVDRDTTEYLTRVDDPDLETAVRRALGVVVGVPLERRRADISCPVCGGAVRRVDIPNTVNSIDVCDAHGTWFDRDELAMFTRAHGDERAGEITPGDLRAAGVGGEGFFSRVFRSVFG